MIEYFIDETILKTINTKIRSILIVEV